jgi:hypothetical protein
MRAVPGTQQPAEADQKSRVQLSLTTKAVGGFFVSLAGTLCVSDR